METFLWIAERERKMSFEEILHGVELDKIIIFCRVIADGR